MNKIGFKQYVFNKIHTRINFGKIKHLAETPDLLEVQIQSFKEFFQLETTPDKRNIEGLFKVFKENFPITDTRKFSCWNSSITSSIRPVTRLKSVWNAGLTYAVPLKANCA